MFIGLMIGAFFGCLTAFVTWGWKDNLYLGLVVGCSMLINMTLATVIGTFTPFALKKFKIDPAIASGPVIATAIDVLGLIVYLSMVTFYFIQTN